MTLKFAYFGVEIALEWQDTDLTEQIEHLLLPIWKHDPRLQPQAVFRLEQSADGLLLKGPDDEVQRGDRDQFLETLERRLHFYLANHCRNVVFVHAGAVAWQGGAILIPGKSYSGKSTLTEELVRVGASYLSDEYAVVDQQGLVHPFPRPIALREPRGERRVFPERLQLAPLTASFILATHFETGAVWKAEPLSQGGGVMELLAHTVTARTDPALAMSCLTACTRYARCLRGPRGEAKETVALLLSELTRPSS